MNKEEFIKELKNKGSICVEKDCECGGLEFISNLLDELLKDYISKAEVKEKVEILGNNIMLSKKRAFEDIKQLLKNN